ncbi:MAG: TetR/AcrR family transcriptional regulator [Acidimicrobiales bacterium]
MPANDRATRDRLLQAARGLVEAGGIESLSMRKVAAEAGVAPTAIYWHFGGREELLHAVLDAMIADLEPLAARGTTPHRRIASLVRAMRAQVASTAPMQQLAAELGRGAELSVPVQVTLAGEMTAAGLHGEEAANAMRSVLFMVGGFILVEENYRHRPPGSRTTQELWQGIDDDAIDPGIRAAMQRAPDSDGLFRYALDRMLDAVLP